MSTVVFRRFMVATMATAVALILAALCVLAVYYKGEAKQAQTERAQLLASLESATRTINGQLEAQKNIDEKRAALLAIAVKQVNDELKRTIEALFAEERSRSKAENDRLAQEIRKAQTELARRIAEVVQGPPGPAGPPGPGGPPPSTPVCLLFCD